MKERQMRIRLERKLKIAEDSLRRLDGALRRSGVKLDVDVFADVKTLMVFFEERCVLGHFLRGSAMCAIHACLHGISSFPLAPPFRPPRGLQD